MPLEKRSADTQRMHTGAHGAGAERRRFGGACFLHEMPAVRERLPNRSSAAHGFTLLEVVIVVFIIAILASAVMPRVMQERTTRLKSATDDIIDLFVRARMRAASGSHAFGVRVEIDEQNGTISVHQGTAAACTSIEWDEAVPVGKRVHPEESDSRAKYGLVFKLDYPEQHGDIRVTEVLPNGITRVCYTPDGRMVDAQTGKVVPASNTTYAAGEFAIEINAHYNDAPMGVPHRVIVPWSGTPRFTYIIDGDTEEGLGGT